MNSLSADDDEIAKTWNEKPDVIRTFIEVRPQFEQLCSEVAYILEKIMNDNNIEYSAITSRAKTLNSFAEKLSRKQYNHPLKELTDLAGVRVVYLYKSDRPVIEKIIEAEFEIIEKIDKIEEQDADRFGYGALHYLIHLGRKSSGARYDDLKGMICEIQVRTVLQDAWAIIDHHLVYKQESDVPNILKRKLNSLSGLFEIADDQFDRVRDEREAYRESVKSKLNSKGKFIDQELNLDTLSEFLKLRFPDKQEVAKNPGQLSRFLSAAINSGYNTLSDVDALLKRTKKVREVMENKKPTISAATEAVRAIALERPETRSVFIFKPETMQLIKEGERLLSSSKKKS